MPEIFERCRALIAERRETPTDDLTSVLVHAEVDGERLEEHEIVMGFFLLDRRRQRQHQGDLLQRDAGADREPATSARRLLDDPALIPSAVEESLRMFPAFAHFRRTATERRRAQRPDDPRGREGGDVVRVVEPRRVALRGSGPLRRHPQPRAPGVRRRRPALLPRRRAGAARAADPVRGDAEALPGDGARRPRPSTPTRRSSTSSRRCRSACAPEPALPRAQRWTAASSAE